MDGHSTRLPRGEAIVGHRMTAEIDARGFLLHEHPLCSGIFGYIGQVNVGHGRSIAHRSHAEEVHLPLHIGAAAGNERIQDFLVDLHQLGAVYTERIESTRFNEILHCTLVHIAAGEHTGAEILEGSKKPSTFTLPHHRLDKSATDVLDGHKAEADAALLHSEAIEGMVHIGQQQRNTTLLTLGDIFRHLVGVIQHRGQQRRHVLLHIVALEPRRLISHDGVADSVSLIEGVVGEIVDLVIDGLCRRLGDAVLDTAADTATLITVDEGVALFFDLLGLFLGDGAAHHVGLSEGEAAQLLEDLNDLLLVDDTAVSHRQNRLKGGMLVGNEFGIVLAGDKARDRLHRAGSIQGDNSGNIFNRMGLETKAHTGHAGGLHLEHAGGLTRRQHLKDLIIMVGDVLKAEIGRVLLHHLHRVIQHRQVTQTQEVHLQ